MSKNKCIDLINSDNNIDELFGISVFNDGIIRFRIYTDLKNKNLIENDIDHKIELIEDDNRTHGLSSPETYVKASRVEKGKVTNEKEYPATKELMITLTKDVGNDMDINVLEQYRRLISVCLKPELDKDILKFKQVDHLKIILNLENLLMIKCLTLENLMSILRIELR